MRYESVDEFIDGYARFILPGKMFVPLQESQLKPVDSRVRFEFRLADGSRALVGEGVVENVRGGDEVEGPTGLVVRYTKMSRRSKQLVGQIVDQKRAEARSEQEQRTGEAAAREGPPGETAPPPEAGGTAPDRDDHLTPLDESGMGVGESGPAEPADEAQGMELGDESTEPGDFEGPPGAADESPTSETVPPEGGEPSAAPEEIDAEASGAGEPAVGDEPSDELAPGAEEQVGGARETAPPEASQPADPGGSTGRDEEPEALEDDEFDFDLGDDEGADADEEADGAEAGAGGEFSGFEEFEESEADASEGFTQLGETEAGLQVMAMDDGEVTEEGAESFAEFQEGSEEEDVDELFEGVFDGGGGDAEAGGGGDLFGGGGDEADGGGDDLFGGGDAGDEADEMFGGPGDETLDGDVGPVGDEAADESGLGGGDDMFGGPSDETVDGDMDPVGEADLEDEDAGESGLGAAESAGAGPDEEPEEATEDESLDDLEPGHEATTAEGAEPIAEADEPTGTGDEISSAIEEELGEDELADEGSDEGAESLDADSFSEVEEEDPTEGETRPAGHDAASPPPEADEAAWGDEDTSPAAADEMPDLADEMDAASEEVEPDAAGDEPSAPENDAPTFSGGDGSFAGAREDDRELDEALASLDDEEASEPEEKGLSLSVGSNSGAEEPSKPSPDERTDSDSLEALVADAQKDIEKKQQESEEDDGDPLDEVLGEDLPPPPEDDFEFEVPNSGPDLEDEEESPPEDQQLADEESESDGEPTEPEEGEKGSGFFSNFFGED